MVLEVIIPAKLIKLSWDNFLLFLQYDIASLTISRYADVFLKKFTVGLKKIAKKKEADEVFDSIKKYAATATVEGYEKIVSLCTSVRMQGTNTAITQTVLDSYRRQLDIMRLLSSDLEEYTVADIKASKYFSGTHFATSLFLEYLNKMIADGSIERGSATESYCVAGSTEKRILKRKGNDYDRATSMMAAAGSYNKFFEAADLFASLGDYLDSAKKAEECRITGEQFKAEMEAIEARHREEQRLERDRQEAERKAAEEKRRAEIKIHNDTVNAKIAEAEQALKEQNAIYTANAGKIFGPGAKLKKTAKAEIARLESAIANLKRTLR